MAAVMQSMEACLSHAASWLNWQRSVLDLLRSDVADAFEYIGMDDLDWAAWRRLYEQGCTPRAAINRALERD
ncbi:MAG TPA: hypothetical protein VK695_02345 [Steroidobacteraceae bacterium]|jgi:hypothetical protein|nr:hypothetical protein [Steroidobacteraceae bacterium]